MSGPVKIFIQRLFGFFGLEVKRRESRHITPITAEWLGQFFYFTDMYQRIRSLPGDIVECGVGKGRTFLYFAFLVAAEDKGRTLWGFDSFSGFPEPTPEDASPRNPKRGEKIADREKVLTMIAEAQLSQDFIGQQIKLIPGFFKESLTRYTGKEIALLHIDVDLYRSYQDVLKALYPKVVHGGLILLDEYNTVEFPGAKQAVDEYLSGTNVRIERNKLTGKYFIIKP